MTRPSSVDQLPEEMREAIGQLRQSGWTIDQIREHLMELYDRAPSRSALGRHVKGFDKISERMRNARLLAQHIGRGMGDASMSQQAQMNIEMMNGTIMELFMAHADGETDSIDEGGRAALAGNPKGIESLAKGMDHLARASKTNLEFLKAAEDRAAERERKKNVDVVEKVGKARGISTETLEEIKRGIFGVGS